MNRFSLFKVALLSAAGFAFSACPPPVCDPEVDDCPDDGGVPPEDFCNSKADSTSDPRCKLTLCMPLTVDAGAFINPPGDGGMADQDWYSVTVGTLTPRSLLHVQAGYQAPATAVDLKINVIEASTMMSVATATDDHGQKPPSPIDIITPFSDSNAQLYILVSDKGNRIPPVYDIRNPYTLSVCTQDNPDMNEPNNDAAHATNLDLSSGTASSMGVLATTDDQDWFTFDPGAIAPRKILYMHITSPMDLSPPANYRLAYTLFDPDMVPIAEDQVMSAFLRVDLATARLVKKTGKYTLKVFGWIEEMGVPVLGDLRQTYTVSLQTLPDTDMTEPNDNMAESGMHATPMSLGQHQQFKGSLSYVPDPEYNALDLPSLSNPATLHAKLTVATSGGRFAPLRGPLDRQLRIMAATPGATEADSLNNCNMIDSQTMGCPKGYDPNDATQQLLVGEICLDYLDAGSAQCLWAERNEHSLYEPLKNMEAVVPVPRGNSTRYWVVVQDDGQNYADDLQWTLDVWFDDDPDEAQTHGLGFEGASINSTVTGVISHGFGRLTDYDPNQMNGPSGIRAPNDYDAIPTDLDFWSFGLPGGSDSAWNIQWRVDHADGGSVSAKLAIDIGLCPGSGNCSRAGTLVYEDGPLNPWYGKSLTDRGILYTKTDEGPDDLITVTPAACMCFESKFATLQLTVGATDRDYYAPMRYRITQSSGSYPPPSFSVDGGSVSCPAPLPDGGGSGCGLE
jgi:hypothetical protein